MKRFLECLRLGLICSALIFMISCHKDDNSFNYKDPEVIKVEGIKESYHVITDQDTLHITPSISSNANESDYEYVWGIYEAHSSEFSPVLDTIARTKDLNFPIKLSAKEYYLVNITTNKKTGYSKYSKSILTVNTNYTRGWYVLKDNGTVSDLDQFLTTNGIIPGAGKNLDIFSKINGVKLSGKGTQLTFFSDYASTVESDDPRDTRTLFVGTSNNVYALFINSLKPIRDRKTIFFAGMNEECSDVVAYKGSQTINFINNGRSYALYTDMVNSGVFSTYAMRDDKNTPYQLSPFMLSTRNTNPLLFDNTSSSFVNVHAADGVLLDVKDDENTKLPAQQNNKQALYMGFQKDEHDPVNFTNKAIGWGIFQDKSNPGLKILTRLEPVLNNLKITCDTLQSDKKIYTSSLHTLLIASENLMYFVHNGKDVYSYNLNNGQEQLQFQVPSGEEVTFIKHRVYKEKGFEYDYVMIGTKVGVNYKVRMFEKQSGSLKSKPVFVLEGEGTPKDIMYISPNVNTNTYPTSY